MSVENEAFIDLEQMLHTQTDILWRRKWKELEKEMNRLANAGEWDAAVKIANNINLDDVIEETAALARTLAEAALFLGASRIVNPEESSFFGEPDERLINNGVEQWAVVLERNAAVALQTQAEIQLASMERERQEKKLNTIVKGASEELVKADTNLSRVGRQGTQFSRAAAALMISRMSTAGFMQEASARGIKTYRVSEVMDGATCPVCSLMHNKTYPVSDGMALSGAIMNATDPESLKAVAPFPSQSAANVKRLGGMSQGQLVAGGMNLPPYHPNCRGIATLEVKNSGASLNVLGGSAVQAGVALQSTADLTPDQLGARMFGEFDDVDGAMLDAVLGGGAALIFGDNEGGDNP
jgi:hypothetical protein